MSKGVNLDIYRSLDNEFLFVQGSPEPVKVSITSASTAGSGFKPAMVS